MSFYSIFYVLSLCFYWLREFIKFVPRKSQSNVVPSKSQPNVVPSKSQPNVPSLVGDWLKKWLKSGAHPILGVKN